MKEQKSFPELYLPDCGSAARPEGVPTAVRERVEAPDRDEEAERGRGQAKDFRRGTKAGKKNQGTTG